MKSSNLIEMVMILLEKEKSTAPELSTLLGVSTRTIYRYVNTLSMAEIPIYSEQGKDGGIYIRGDYSPKNKMFTKKDFEMLTSSLKILADTTEEENYKITLQKIKKLIPNSEKALLAFKENRLLIDTTTWDGQKTSAKWIKLINEALDNKVIIEFKYHNMYGDSSFRRIEPYRLILKGTYWYMQGYCLTRRDFRIFKLARIESLNLTKILFNIRPLDYSINPITSWENPIDTKVELLIHKSISDTIANFYGYSTLKDFDDTHFKAEIPFSKTEAEYNFLLGLGQTIKILAPLEVKTTYISKLKNLLSLYT